MTIAAIILLIFLGIFLILLEFLVVPGVTIAGIGGLLCIGGGVYLSYSNYGYVVGNYTLGGTFVLLLVTLYFAFKSKTWKKLMLKTSIDSKVNTYEKEKIKIGDTGRTISRLAPMGKVSVNGEYIEAKSLYKFIDQDTEIEVVKVLNNKIIVKSLK